MRSDMTKKLLVVTHLTKSRLQTLIERFPVLRIVDCSNDRGRVIDEIVDAHIVYGGVTPEQFRAARQLEFIQVVSHGIENLCYPELIDSDVRVACGKGLYARNMAEHMFALILAACILTG